MAQSEARSGGEWTDHLQQEPGIPSVQPRGLIEPTHLRHLRSPLRTL